MAGNDTVFLHLLGKTGTGKSSTGNTILNGKVFNAKSSLAAVTHAIEMREGTLGRRSVVVVDGPGLVGVNTGVSLEAIKMYAEVVNKNDSSKHVFLIVCRYGERFTEEDEDMVKHIKGQFGWKRALENQSIVVLTCGDNFERDTEDEELTFQDWCLRQGGGFSNLRKDCKNRVLLADNSRNSGYQAGTFLADLEREIEKLDSARALHREAHELSQYEGEPNVFQRFFRAILPKCC